LDKPIEHTASELAKPRFDLGCSGIDYRTSSRGLEVFTRYRMRPSFGGRFDARDFLRRIEAPLQSSECKCDDQLPAEGSIPFARFVQAKAEKNDRHQRSRAIGLSVDAVGWGRFEWKRPRGSTSGLLQPIDGASTDFVENEIYRRRIQRGDRKGAWYYRAWSEELDATSKNTVKAMFR